MMNNWIMWLLKPVAFMVEIFLGIPFTYYEGVGFVNNDLNINIARECSGINFFIIIFLMLIFSFTLKIKGKKYKSLALLLFLIYGYILSIFASASRIIATLFIMNLYLVSNMKQNILIHQSIGVVIYFTYLVFTYFVFYKILNRMEVYNEKSV